jgi:ATP-binding cassette subfamily B protein/subfamily B ATP-binding cassette protein MsbA
MSRDSAASVSSMKLCAALLPYARRRWTGFVWITFTTLLSIALGLLKPWPMKFIVDRVLLAGRLPERAEQIVNGLPGASSPKALLYWGVLATIALFLLGWGVKFVSSLAQVWLGQSLVYDLAADVYAQLQRLSLRFHHNKSVGDSIRRVTSDCGCVSSIIKDALLPLASSMLTLLIMVGVMWQLDHALTLIAVAVMPAMVVVLRLYAGPMMDRSYQQQELESKIYDDIEQTFSAIAVVQAFHREDRHDRQFREHTRDAIAASLCTTNVQLQFKILTGLLTSFGTAAIIWVGARHVIDGQLTVGTILVFLAYLSSLYGPIEAIMYCSSAVQGASGSARRVVEVLRAERDVDDRPGAIDPPSPVRGHLRFERITFGYDAAREVLHDISFEITPGEMVAIVGATGAGKSTLACLAPRFNDPKSGRVLLDGRDLRELTLSGLRKHISLVLQDSFLFPISIAQNIAYCNPNASRDEIVRAARAANAHEFITQLPHGYETIVGERGATLSGGQRQRISIARALLRNAPILILDEPTSNLDATSEQAVFEAVRRLVAGRTTLVIAHRLSTVRHADRIIVLEQGRVVETGTHEQLSSVNGVYARLYRSQHLVSSGNEAEPS